MVSMATSYMILENGGRPEIQSYLEFYLPRALNLMSN